MSFFQRVFRKNSESYTQSDAISAAETAPSSDTDGVAMSSGAQFIQFFPSDLDAITDYSLQLWAYINSKWTCFAERLNLGTISRWSEVALTASGATRYMVRVSAITGTSLKKNYRQV
jgi:hypothetical protein